MVEGVKTDPVYGILKNVLMQMPESYPFRGPKRYTEGKLDRFSGEEKIIQEKKGVIYKANYMGGLVDQRRGV